MDDWLRDYTSHTPTLTHIRALDDAFGARFVIGQMRKQCFSIFPIPCFLCRAHRSAAPSEENQSKLILHQKWEKNIEFLRYSHSAPINSNFEKDEIFLTNNVRNGAAHVGWLAPNGTDIASVIAAINNTSAHIEKCIISGWAVKPFERAHVLKQWKNTLEAFSDVSSTSVNILSEMRK